MTVYVIDTAFTLIDSTGTARATLDAISASWTLDEGQAPYATATMTVQAPSSAVYALLAPAAGNFVRLSATAEGAVQAVTPILRIQSRLRQPDGTVQLTLSGPEQTLMDWSPYLEDDFALSYQSDFTSTIYHATEAAHGEGIEMDQNMADAVGVVTTAQPYAAFSAAENTAANGSFEYGVTAWTGGNATLATSTHSATGFPVQGTRSLGVAPSSTSTSDSYAGLTSSFNVSPGDTWTVSGTICLNGAQGGTPNARARSIVLVGTVNGTPAVVGQSNIATNAAGVTLCSITYLVPMDGSVTTLSVRLYSGAISGAANNTVYWDGISILSGSGIDTDGATPIPYFDGDTVDGLNGYSYAWEGTAGNSSSTRTPLVDRGPDALVWAPGTSAWDYLNPILQTLGTRLFGTGYTTGVAGHVYPVYRWVTSSYASALPPVRYVAGESLYDLQDTASRTDSFPDGTPMFADGVVLEYQWNDDSGVARTAYDVYPTKGGYAKPYTVEYADTPYPGPGRAKSLYTRMKSRAEVLSVVGPYTPNVIPGSEITVTAPQLGGSFDAYVDAVTHDPIAGTTTIRTKQAVGYPADAWAAFSSTNTWASLTATWGNL